MVNIDKEIEKEKGKLIAEALESGLYENFGQNEVRKLEDKLSKEYDNPYTSQEAKQDYQKVKDFNEWAMTFDENKLREAKERSR